MAWFFYFISAFFFFFIVPPFLLSEWASWKAAWGCAMQAQLSMAKLQWERSITAEITLLEYLGCTLCMWNTITHPFMCEQKGGSVRELWVCGRLGTKPAATSIINLHNLSPAAHSYQQFKHHNISCEVSTEFNVKRGCIAAHAEGVSLNPLH